MKNLSKECIPNEKAFSEQSQLDSLSSDDSSLDAYVNQKIDSNGRLNESIEKYIEGNRWVNQI